MAEKIKDLTIAELFDGMTKNGVLDQFEASKPISAEILWEDNELILP